MIGPQTLLPAGVEALGVRVFHDMREGLKDCDVVVMLRLQNERMRGALSRRRRSTSSTTA